MKMILKLGGGGLIAAMAISAIGCSKSGAASNLVNAPTASTPPANASAPIISPPQSAEDKMPRVSVEETKKLVAEDKAIIIDVRGPDGYKMAHIKGALDVSLGKLESGDFKGLPKDKRIIAYCTWPAEHTSARAALLLQQNGFKDASALLGGMSAWEAAGGAMEKAAPPPESAKKK